MPIWNKVEDGEYNEHETTIGNHKITLYSNRDSSLWWYRVDDEESNSLDIEDATLEMAQKETVIECRLNGIK